jgi:threonine dehydratase
VSDTALPETVTLNDVRAAYALLQPHVARTPLVYSPEFSRLTGNEIHFKLEVFQRTHAFKARGALNKLFNLSPEQRQRGVVAASSGNHGLGVAYGSSLLGVKATIVMPTRAPETKVELARLLGATVVLHGETYDDALAQAETLAAEGGRVLMPSFDDPVVIAGQGTIALEVLEALPQTDIFLAPIGGGGLVAGLAVTLAGLGHPAEVIGVEAEGAACMLESLRTGHRVRLPHIQTLADGIAVQQPGQNNFEIVRRSLKTILTVSDDQICDAMWRMLRFMNVIVEPAAAAAVAALLCHPALQGRRQTICCVVTGGNISDALLRQIVANSPRVPVV